MAFNWYIQSDCEPFIMARVTIHSPYLMLLYPLSLLYSPCYSGSLLLLYSSLWVLLLCPLIVTLHLLSLWSLLCIFRYSVHLLTLPLHCYSIPTGTLVITLYLLLLWSI